MQRFFAFLTRLVLLAAGLVFAAGLLAVVACVVALWAVRYGWARLTGRPVAPFVVHIDPRAGFERMYRRPAQAAPGKQPQPDRGPRAAIEDVTDVQAKPPRL